MKKLILTLVAAAAVIFASGCAGGYVNNYGFGSTVPGAIYTNQVRGTFMLPKLENLDGVEVLGKAHGKATSTTVLLLIALGDGGIEAAKRDALKAYPQADDILNVEIDTRYESILSLYDHSTTILNGIAVKYKK